MDFSPAASGMMRYVPGKSRSSHPFSVSRDAISRAAFGATSRVVSMSSTEMIWWPSAASRERSRLSRVESPADYFAFVLRLPYLRFVHRIYNRTDLSVVPPLADGPNPVNQRKEITGKNVG